jgi:transglutaminase-like putative cysteine protease
LPDELGAKYALENHRGDCTEFADLSVAMSRSLGIPGRVLGGYFVENDAVLRARDYHNWAEVLVDGRWTLVDAQRGFFRNRPDRYIAFHVITAGLSNEMRGAERFRADSGLLVHWN